MKDDLSYYHDEFRQFSSRYLPHGDLEQFQGKDYDLHVPLNQWLYLRSILIRIASCNKIPFVNCGVKENVLVAGYIGVHGQFTLNIYPLPELP